MAGSLSMHLTTFRSTLQNAGLLGGTHRTSRVSQAFLKKTFIKLGRRAETIDWP